MKNLAVTVAILIIAIGASALLFGAGRVETTSVAVENASAFESTAAVIPGRTLSAFRSEAELKKYLRSLAKRRSSSASDGGIVTQGAPVNSVAAPVAKAENDDNESVTNTQHAGVDEGGIVKLHGNHLVILRRGRLFSVAIGDESLRPVSAVDAFAPDLESDGTWYDEMLISANTIAVIGYSYQRGGTEIGLFNIDARGNLKYRDTYHLRSFDYYSSRNYASRLVDGKLVFYTPEYLLMDGDDPLSHLPAIRKWHKGATANEFQNIIRPTRVYRPARKLNVSYDLALHTVTICDPESPEFKCEATGVIGPAGRVFYVSPASVYIWATDWRYRDVEPIERSTLYQMPLDGSAPRALGVSGTPIDQFSFLESDDHHLNVLLRREGGGEAMWGSESTSGEMALLRVPLSSFSDGTRSAAYWQYKSVPTADGNTLQNRYVGDFLLYGRGDSWEYRSGYGESTLYAVRWKSGKVRELALGHSVDRIEAMGENAVVVGTRENGLYFSPIELGRVPTVKTPYVRKNASQGELRSHGFFYKPTEENTGMLGLPIAEAGRPGYEHLFEGSASILFLRNDSLKLSEIGALASENTRPPNDNCKASCVDWYGNARPLFLRGRIFALLGYEIVEGSMAENGIREKRRTNFSPRRSNTE